MNAIRPQSDDIDTQGQNHPHLAYLLFRLAVGMSMAIHGLIRIAHGPGQFAAELAKQFAASPPARRAGLRLRIVSCLVRSTGGNPSVAWTLYRSCRRGQCPRDGGADLWLGFTAELDSRNAATFLRPALLHFATQDRG